MSPEVLFEYLDNVVDPDAYRRLVGSALTKSGVAVAEQVRVVFSGDLNCSVNERLGQRPIVYRSTHRGGSLTVAKTMARSQVGLSDVIVNAALLTPDLQHVCLGENNGATERYLAHEFLHALVRARSEPNTDVTNAGDSVTTEVYWRQRAWRLLDEHRVERALSTTWPQDIDFAHDYRVRLTGFVYGICDPMCDIQAHFVQQIPPLFESFAYTIGSAGSNNLQEVATRLPALAAVPLAFPADLVGAILAVPDARTPASEACLGGHVERIAGELVRWVQTLGCALADATTGPVVRRVEMTPNGL